MSVKIVANSHWQVQGQDLYQISAARLRPIVIYIFSPITSISRLFLRTLIRTASYRLYGTVNTPEINRTIPDTVSNLADNRGDSQVIDIICRNDLEPNCIIVVEIADALKWTIN